MTTPEPVIRPLTTPAEMAACQDLQKEVWGLPERDIVPVVELVSAVTARGCLAGAFLNDEMVGFVYGFWGLHRGEVYHYSRMLGVKPGLRGAGLGRRLKLWQREFVLGMGIQTMRWTFDPLEGANATLNIGRLGATAPDYIEDYYGPKDDDLNRDLPTDRLFVTWDLDGDRTEQRAGGVRGPCVTDLVESGPFSLAGEPDDTGLMRPVAVSPERAADAILIEIPRDFQNLKTAEPHLARQWRFAVRDAFQSAFAAGFQVEEFASGELEGRRRSVYQLVKGE